MKNHAKRRPKLARTKTTVKNRIGRRETAILQSLYKYRFLTTDQIFNLHFLKGSQSYCNERLRVLFHKPYQYVNRTALPVEWGKGSSKLVYTLTKQGADHLQNMGLYAAVSPNKAYKMKSGTSTYRRHEIAINDVRIAVEKTCEAMGWELTEWISDTEFKNSSLLSQMRVRDSESSAVIPVAPDGFFAIRRPGVANETLFFLELDRGTMENKRFRVKKIRGYHLFGDVWRDVPMFKKYKNNPFTYRVLTVVDGGAERTHNLQVNCAEKEFEKEDQEDRVNKSKRFWFTELPNVVTEEVFQKPVWLVPFQSKNVEERYPLFDKI
jgi:hypothetical protein